MSAPPSVFEPEAAGNRPQSSVERFSDGVGPADPSKINISDLAPSGGLGISLSRALALWTAVALTIGVTVAAAIHYTDRSHGALAPITECELDDAAEGVCTRGTP